MEEEINFRGKRPDEKVFLVAKQHPWLLIGIPICWLIIIAVLVISYTLLGASKFSSIILVATLIIGTIYTVYQLFLWNNGIYIVTSQRVIKIDQDTLFSREISETEIDRIQEIATEINGPIHTLLNFGTIHIKTASNTSRMDLDDVADPYDIQQQIAQVQQRVRQEPRPNQPRQV